MTPKLFYPEKTKLCFAESEESRAEQWPLERLCNMLNCCSKESQRKMTRDTSKHWYIDSVGRKIVHLQWHQFFGSLSVKRETF